MFPWCFLWKNSTKKSHPKSLPTWRLRTISPHRGAGTRWRNALWKSWCLKHLAQNLETSSFRFRDFAKAATRIPIKKKILKKNKTTTIIYYTCTTYYRGHRTILPVVDVPRDIHGHHIVESHVRGPFLWCFRSHFSFLNKKQQFKSVQTERKSKLQRFRSVQKKYFFCARAACCESQLFAGNRVQ